MQDSVLAGVLVAESKDAVLPEILDALTASLLLAQEQLRLFAADEAFVEKTGVAFGTEANVSELQAAWLADDFSIFAGVELRTAAELNGALGAYATPLDRIYLAQELLATGDVERIAGVLLEEAGHRVDARVNASDSPGDEGAIFSELVSTGEVAEQALAGMQVEDDAATLKLDGQLVTVEQSGNNAPINTLPESITSLGNTLTGTGATDQFGLSSSLSGDGKRIIVGAPFADINAVNNGYARVYENINGVWTQLGSDFVGDEFNTERAGFSVSISSDGTTIAIGENHFSGGSGGENGRVKLYRYNETAQDWDPLGTSFLEGENAGDVFGVSVSLSADGSRVAVGGSLHDGLNGNSNASGYVQIYEFDTINPGEWAQLGADIYGDNSGDEAGRQVALSPDGTRVAIGAPFFDGSGNEIGQVRFFEFNGSSWAQIGELTGDNRLGNSLSWSADGNRIAIGELRYDGVGQDSGRVQIFDYAGGSNWTKVGSDIEGEATDDLFGLSVDLAADGNSLIVGALRTDENGLTDSGQAKLYRFENGDWQQFGPEINGVAAGDDAGYSVQISDDGSIVALGARLNDDAADDAGHVRLFRVGEVVTDGVVTPIPGVSVSDADGDLASTRLTVTNGVLSVTLGGGAMISSGANNSSDLTLSGSEAEINAALATLTYQGSVGLNGSETLTIVSTDSAGTALSDTDTLPIHVINQAPVNTINTPVVATQIGEDIDGEAKGDFAGGSVALSADGSVVAIGAERNNGNGDSSGHVRLYENLNGVWTQIGDDIDGEAAGDGSGRSVALSADGSVVAIGASGNDGNGDESGHVRLYQNINGVWTKIGNDIDGEDVDDFSGQSAALSADGSVVAIGATGNDGNGDGSGHVRLYENLNGIWTQIGDDIDGEAAGDGSGGSVALSADGSVVAIGASRNDGNGDNSGHVRLYQNINGTWTQIGDDIDGEAVSDQSGSSVSLSADGSVVAIGATNNDGNGDRSGHVRLYENVGSIWNSRS